MKEPQTHVHEWKRADDWDWGPGTVTFECFPCRGLRIERPDASLDIEGDPDTLAGLITVSRPTGANPQ